MPGLGTCWLVVGCLQLTWLCCGIRRSGITGGPGEELVKSARAKQLAHCQWLPSLMVIFSTVKGVACCLAD